MSTPYSPTGTTARSLAHSPLIGARLRDLPELVVALAHVKRAAAIANAQEGLVSEAVSQAIVAVCDDIVAGRHHDGFTLPIIAAGGGTATNMNANEVIAHLASERSGLAVHPNDHVNRSQSSNDVYPTALKLALHPIAVAAADELDRLGDAFAAKADEQGDATRLGRTVWQDAVIVPIRDTHLGQAAAMHRLADDLRAAGMRLLRVQLGGTVLGTRAGASTSFAERTLAQLRAATGLDVQPSASLTDAFAHADAYAVVADAAARAAAILHKIGQDLRILSSGPHAGLGELRLPAIQPGSSIMPGKVNPVIPNLVIQTSFGIRAAASAVSMAVAAGEPDINVNGPAIAAQLPQALHSLRESTALLTDHCVVGMRWDLERLEQLKRGGYDALMDLAATSGYDAAAQHAARTA